MTARRTHQCEARVATEWGPRCGYKAKVEIAGSRLCGVHAKLAPLLPQDLVVPARTKRTFRIVAYPNGEGERSTLEILPEGTDRADARSRLGDWLDAIEDTGHIPHRWTLEWQWSPPTAVLARYRDSARIRCEAWEHETENGYDEGHGWIRIVEEDDG